MGLSLLQMIRSSSQSNCDMDCQKGTEDLSRGAHYGPDTLTALPAHVTQRALLASYLHPAWVVLALKITTVTFENDIQKATRKKGKKQIASVFSEFEVMLCRHHFLIAHILPGFHFTLANAPNRKYNE